jgi:hypothetical protein
MQPAGRATRFGAARDFVTRVSRIRGSLAAGALVASLSVSVVQADPFDGPSFRYGMWRFERTLERIVHFPNVRFLMQKEEITRCVDPTNAMKYTFASPDIGHCRSAKPERAGNHYVFPTRCDYMGPVRTEITVESDVAYIEVNELTVGSFPRTDTVVARRIGDCKSTD